MLITAEDIYSRIYPENVGEIVRDNDNLIPKAIAGAEEEAKMYLSKYDLAALFGSGDDEPTFHSPFLKQICVDLACWQLIRLGNPNIDYNAAKTDYDNAIRKVKDIQSGKANPEGWPYRDTTNDTEPNGNAVEWKSRPRRNNYFN